MNKVVLSQYAKNGKIATNYRQLGALSKRDYLDYKYLDSGKSKQSLLEEGTMASLDVSIKKRANPSKLNCPLALKIGSGS